MQARLLPGYLPSPVLLACLAIAAAASEFPAPLPPDDLEPPLAGLAPPS